MDTLLEYLKPPVRYRRRLWGVTAILAALASWISVDTVGRYQNTLQIISSSNQLRTTQAKLVPLKPSRIEIEDQKRWTILQAERDFAWEPLFQAIEHASSTEIELLEFQPDKLGRHLTLRGEAIDSKALTNFLEALAAQKVFSNVYLVHQQNEQRDRLATISFEIKANLLN